MKKPRPVSSTESEPRPNKRESVRGVRRNTVALALMAGALLQACSGGSSDQTGSIPEAAFNTTTTTEQTNAVSPELQRSIRENLKISAVQSALSILNDLDRSDSGSRGYDTTRIGNKRAIVGADGQFNTPDDAEFQGKPEMLAVFDPESRLVYLSSVAAYPTGNDSYDFSEVTLGFSVGRNSILSNKAEMGLQLNTYDFRDAIIDPQTELVGVGAQLPEDELSYGLNFVGEYLISNSGLVGDFAGDLGRPITVPEYAIAAEGRMLRMLPTATTQLSFAAAS